MPYTLAVAEFPEGVKVFGRIDKSLTDDAVKPGMKVKVRTVNLENEHISYEFIAA
ncbi:MAG: OB-fold domain-containing protein [Bacteriovorax sp.]